jgi:hypothetical protein
LSQGGTGMGLTMEQSKRDRREEQEGAEAMRKMALQLEAEEGRLEAEMVWAMEEGTDPD